MHLQLEWKSRDRCKSNGFIYAFRVNVVLIVETVKISWSDDVGKVGAECIRLK